MTTADREAQDARMRRLYVTEGKTIRLTAELMGLSRNVVQYRLGTLGLLRPLPSAWLGPVPDAMRPHIQHACKLAYETVTRIAPPNTPEHNRDDWDSFARLAALRALGTYDASRGFHWKSWVIQKVRWEIVEEIRSSAPFSRAAWKQMLADALAEDPGLAAPERRDEWEQVKFHMLSGHYPVSLETLQESQLGVYWDDVDPQRVWEPSWAPDPVEWLLARAVKEAVAALPARWRYVIQRAEAGYSHEEIASALGITHHGVDYLAAEARERLREALAEWA